MTTRDQEHRVVDQDASVTTGESGGADGRVPDVSTGAVLPVDKDCTCGEPPHTGHFLWCESLRGRPEFRPLDASSGESVSDNARVPNPSIGPVSLTDLKAKRSAMSPGEWERMGHTFVSPEYDVGRCDAWADADGIVATHAAADVLIEIAEAALAVSEQDCLRDSKATYALRAALAKITT